jgi:hypothetical protein
LKKDRVINSNDIIGKLTLSTLLIM